MLKLLLSIISILIFSTSALSQSTFSVEAGAQWDDVTGNEDSYKSQVNEDSGLLLHALRYAFINSKEGSALMDRFQIDASGFGAVPHGRVKIDAGNARGYRLKLEYSRFEHFSAIAINPQPEPPGILHSIDRTRQRLNVELELLPQYRLRPVIGYSWNSYDGPGRESYHVGGDEFALDSQLDESETEITVGLAYETSRIQAEVMQGWRDFSGTEDRTAQLEEGQSSRPILGNDIVLDNYTSRTRYDSETPVTRALFKARATDQVRILATYIHADASSEIAEDESYSGSFASYAINRFFNGASASVRSKTEAPSWRGNVRLEVELPADFELDLGYTRRNRKMDGNSLIETLYLDSVTFSNSDPRNYQDLINAESHMERDEDSIEAVATAHGIENFRFWAGWSTRSEDITVDQALAEIVVSNGQEGDFTRDTDALRFGAAFVKKRHLVSVEWKSEEADEAVMRTDFLDRDTLTARIRTNWNNKVYLSGKARWFDVENPTPAIEYQMDLFNAGVDLEFMLPKKFNCRLSYAIFDLESETAYRDPEFVNRISFHREDGNQADINLGWENKRWMVEGRYGRHDSEGAIPYTLDEAMLSLELKISDDISGIFHGRIREYQEESNPLADYDADTFSLLVRWRK